MSSLLDKLKQNKKAFIIVVAVLLLIVLYVAGLFSQSTVTNVYGRSDVSLNPFVCIGTALTSSTGWMIIGVIAFIIAGTFFYKKMLRGGESMEDERNFTKSKKGSYGTSGWMTDLELKAVLKLTNINSAEGNIGTILGIKNGKIVSLPLDSRLNKHTAIYGASGTGKSRCFVRPQILQCSAREESLIITDPKGEIYADAAAFLRKEGYNVKVFNLVDPQYSDSWNCLLEICKAEGQKELMAQTFAEVVIKNTMQGGKADHFWDNAEMNLLKALVLYIAMDENRDNPDGTPTIAKNIGAAYELLTSCDEKKLNQMFDKLPASHPAKQPYGIFKQSSESVRGNVIVGLGSRLQVFQSDIIRKITTYDEIDLEMPAKHKSAYFVIMSDQDSTLDFLSSLFFSFLFIRLVRYADVKGTDGKCDVPVNFILDEFPNIGSIPDFTKKLSTIRSRDLRVAVIFQNIAQLQNRYPMGLWEEIVGNCDTQLFLGCTDQMTAKFISDRTGEMTIEVVSQGVQKKSIALTQSIPDYRENKSIGKRVVLTPDEVLRLPNNNALVIIRGQKVLKVEKFDYSKHPAQDKFIHEYIRDHVPEWKKKQKDGKFNKEKEETIAQAKEAEQKQEKDDLDLTKIYNNTSSQDQAQNTARPQNRSASIFGPSSTKKTSRSQFSAPTPVKVSNNQFGGKSQFSVSNNQFTSPVKTVPSSSSQFTNNNNSVVPQQKVIKTSVPTNANPVSVSVDDF